MDNTTIQCPKCFGELPHAEATKCMHCGSSVKPSQSKKGVTQSSGRLLGVSAHRLFSRITPLFSTFGTAAKEAWTAEAAKRNTDDK